jgi:hypothetical protein
MAENRMKHSLMANITKLSQVDVDSDVDVDVDKVLDSFPLCHIS